VAQRASSADADAKALAGQVTRYGVKSMAGSCAVSAAEVGRLLGRSHVGYIATVYRDQSGEVRNHIAALRRVDGQEQVVDATWKQFPYLWNQQARASAVVDLESLPLILFCTIDEWTAMIADYTPGISDRAVTQLDSAAEASSWMRDERRRLLDAPLARAGNSAAAGNGRGSRGCTIF
jgi:hypothetical protein